MMTGFSVELGGQAARRWFGLLFLAVAFFAFEPVEKAINAPLAAAWSLPMMVRGEMSLPHYAVLMVVRLLLDLLVVAGVFIILGHRWIAFPLTGPKALSRTFVGLATGFVVMTGAILAIIVTGNAVAAFSSQSTGSALAHGTGWLISDFVGATGEELYGRVAVLLVAERFLGWRGATLVSGLMFSALYFGNPGASWLWLLRLFLQGMLLAYAVYRTRSVWWSAGYHTGWNWASAPLFGAAGSGYPDQGEHLRLHAGRPAMGHRGRGRPRRKRVRLCRRAGRVRPVGRRNARAAGKSAD